MQATILLVADFANVDPSGKLNVIGAFNRIYTAALPATHPMMYLVIRLVAELGEYEHQRTLRFILFDEDGHTTWEPPGLKFTVPRPQDGNLGEFTPVFGIQNMRFEKPGRYEFRVLVDNDLKGTVPIEVVKVASEA